MTIVKFKKLQVCLFVFVSLFMCSHASSMQFIQGKPQVVSTSYSNWDVPIVSYDASLPPYNADKTGSADATVAIQKAIDDCALALGGIVYLPEGRYRINGKLRWKSGVTVRGDWKKPTNEDKSVKGTILCIYTSKGLVDDESPITIDDNTGIRDLSIYYPEQVTGTPIPYPYTIRCDGQLMTVLNVTLVNPYQAIRYERDTLTIGFPNVRNVYGSPLYRGIRLNKAAAVPRITSLHFTPNYWSESGLPNSPSYSQLLTTMRQFGSKGLELANSDNGIIGDLEIVGYDTGIHIGAIGNGSSGISNMKMYDFKISECRIGIDAESYKVQGWNFSKGVVAVDGENCTALLQRGGDALIFDAVSFQSAGSLIVSESGTLGLTNCDFIDWQEMTAIKKTSGKIMVCGCKFLKTGVLTTNQYHIYLNSDVLQSAISGNSFLNTSARIFTENKNYNNIVIDTISTTTVTDPQFVSYQFADRPKPTQVNLTSLFNVNDYGAVGDIVTDNTLAFKSALKAAEMNGGGTVYVPGGAYAIKGRLIIPTGVEMRGVHDLPSTTDEFRSILLSYVDLSNPGDSAFITLKGNSGLRGLLLYRPQQKYNALNGDTIIYNLPYVVRAVGANCWVQNVVIPNADKGIDFASTTGGGHFIDYYFASPLGTCLCVYAGNNPSNVENMQTNPVFFRGIKGALDWSLFNSSATISNGIKNTAPLASQNGNLYPRGTACSVLGDGVINFYANFYNSPFKGYLINGSPRMKTLLSGGEGENFYEAISAGELDLKIIANTYHPLKSENPSFGKFDLSPNANGKIQIYNTISFGNPPIAYWINNGNLLLQSGYQTVALDYFVVANGSAKVKVESMFLRESCNVGSGVDNDAASITFQGTISSRPYLISDKVDLIGCSPVVYSYITGLNKNSFPENDLTIYPNPSTGVVNYSLKNFDESLNILSLRIVNASGFVVYSQKSTPKNGVLRLNFLPKGIYLVYMQAERRQYLKKIIII